MAKKTQEIKYLQMPLPSGQREMTTVRVNWSGLNRTERLDTGELSDEENISTAEAPYLTPSPKRRALDVTLTEPVGLWGFDNFLIVVENVGGTIGAVRINADGSVEREAFPVEFTSKKPKYTYKNAYAEDFNTPRSVVAMSIYEGGAIDGSYTKKLLVFPDRVSMDFDAKGGLNPSIIPGNMMPNIRYATVRLSRLYGAMATGEGKEPDRLCVSGFNDYTNWDVDTDDDFSEAHAWVSAAQSNVRADGCFTGIATYLNSVVAFKRDYMHEITGSSNPFRINDVFAEGATDNRNIVEVDGTLFFVSADAVKVYTGGNPRVMSYKLGLKRFNNAVAGTDGRRYYLYCVDENGRKHIFVYDTLVMQWAEEVCVGEVFAFAHNDVGMFLLGKDMLDEGDGEWRVYRMDTNDFGTSGDVLRQYWRADTDLVLGKTVDIKHVQQIKILADIGPKSALQASLVFDEGDGSERTEQIFAKTNETDKIIREAIRVNVRRSAHWGAKLRLEGGGWSRIYQAELRLRGGGELLATLDNEN